MQSGGQMQGQGSSKSLCDYCHQHPKFLPHDYCSKACGTRAKASGNTHSNQKGPAMCKQCGQRPAYQGHQFCGKKCASTWQLAHGPNNSNSYGPSQPQYGQRQSGQQKAQYPSTSSTQPFQGFGPGGTFTGILSNFKGLISQAQQSRLPPQQPSPPSQSHMQQVSGNMNISPPPLTISPPLTSTSSGMSGSTSPGSNHQWFSPSPSSSIQDLDANEHANLGPFQSPSLLVLPGGSNQNNMPGQNTNMAVDPPNYSTLGSAQHVDSDSDGFGDPPNQDQMVPSNGKGGGPLSVQAQGQTHFSLQVVSPHMGSGGNGSGGGDFDLDQNDPNLFPPLHHMSNASSSSSTCRLKGCSKPAFVDPVTRLAGGYCSKRHREEAKATGQKALCIMCQKMPRSQNDHFCSKACREKALSA